MNALAPSPRRLAWLDFETTGFTDLAAGMVYQHKILEVAIVVTDEAFNVLAQFQQVAHHESTAMLVLCDDVVLAMHGRSGLFDEVEAATGTVEDMELAAIDFLKSAGVECKGSPLCGNGITFDRMFLEAQMPLLNGHLHYRNLDVSAVKEMVKTINPVIEPAKKLAHRAMADILESIAEARTYRALLALGLNAPAAS